MGCLCCSVLLLCLGFLWVVILVWWVFKWIVLVGLLVQLGLLWCVGCGIRVCLLWFVCLGEMVVLFCGLLGFVSSLRVDVWLLYAGVGLLGFLVFCCGFVLWL